MQQHGEERLVSVSAPSHRNHHRSESDSRTRILRLDVMDSSPSSNAHHIQLLKDAKEMKDQNSTSKRPLHATELPNSLTQEVRQLEKRLHDQFAVRRALEKALDYRSCAICSSNDSCIPKPTEELIKEIAVLELEVIYLEQHLLTLYRRAFEQQLLDTSPVSEIGRDEQPARSFSGTLSEVSVLDFSTPRRNQSMHSIQKILAGKSSPTGSSEETDSMQCHDKNSIARSHSSLLQRSICSARVSLSASNLARALRPCHTLPLSFVEETKGIDPSVVSLADILGTRIADHVPQTPNKVSEDMIRCMAAIYCRLRDSSAVQHAFFPSPCSSFSSASGFSSKYVGDIWSPRCKKDNIVETWHDSSFHTSEPKDFIHQYDALVEVSALCKGTQRSADVKEMLHKYKSLVQLLETIDLTVMKNDDKLAFWINVHNAMMMHAHLEHGIPQSNSKRIPLTKVSNIIGGRRINAELIRDQILLCRAHSSTQWLRLLLYPKWKNKEREELQGFAIEHPEPLVYFALSSGSHSDPAVRLYDPKRLYQQLEAAKEEYIRANISILREHKILLPKILESYMRDANRSVQDLLQMLELYLPETLRMAMHQGKQGRSHKIIEWKPHNLAFRYLLSKELTAAPVAVVQR